MKRFLTFGLPVSLGLIAGGMLGALLSRADMLSSGGTPAVSAPPVPASPLVSPQRVDARFVADVEVQGKRYRVYVGHTEGDGTSLVPVWSVAIPTGR